MTGGLLLIGYMPLVEDGFALPIYGTAPVPNQIHLAVAGVEGDHLGRVDRFVETDPLPYVVLQAPHRRVREGDLWIDVFVWGGRAVVGEPHALVEALRPEFQSMFTEEPLVALDLLLATDDPDKDAFGRARSGLGRRHGEAMARRWSVEVIGTRIVRLEVGRAFAEAGQPDAEAVLRIRLTGDDDRVVVSTPDEVDRRMTDLWGEDWARRAYARSPHRTRALVQRSDEPAGSGMIRSIKVQGAHLYPDAEVILASRLKPGLVLSEETLDQAWRGLRGSGLYDHISIDAEDKGLVVITVVETPVLRRIDHSILAGVTGLDPEKIKALLGDIGSQVGRPYRPEQAHADAEQLSARYFAQTDVHVTAEAFASIDHLSVSLVFRFDRLKPRHDREGTALVVVTGRRAETIGRHLRRLETKGEVPLRGGRDAVQPIMVLRGDDLRDIGDHRAGTFAAVAWLADDEAILSASQGDLHRLLDLRSGSAPLLVAPALPDDIPSRALSERNLDLGVDALLVDTSMARSPLAHWGRRSIDRRIADIVVAALELLQDPIGAPSASGPFDRPRLLSWSPDPGYGARFASETTAVDIVKPMSELGVVTSYRDPAALARPGSSVVEEPVRDFEAFAGAVVATSGRPTYRQESGYLPGDLADRLNLPGMAAMFSRDGSCLVVTAETPSPSAIDAAASEGHVLARYTDIPTVRAWLHGEAAPGATPDEILMPRLRRYPDVRGLVLRGVGLRDVIRLPRLEIERFLGLHPGSGLRNVARSYRHAFDDDRLDEMVVPIGYVRHADTRADPVAQLLGQHLRSLRYPARRPDELDRIWNLPGTGLRWCILDGALPVRIRPLQPDEMPGQTMLVMDGDAAVPAMLLSRLFWVWARATMTRSTGWTPRFAITRTFETLPIPRPFIVAKITQTGRPGLFLQDPVMEGLARELATMIEIDGDRGTFERAGLIAEIDRRLLAEFDLGPDVSDIEILQRLISYSTLASRRDGTGR